MAAIQTDNAQINAILTVLTNQREGALNECAQLAAANILLSEEVTALRAQKESTVLTATAPAPVINHE